MRRKKILVVEDDRRFSSLLVELLTMEGSYTVVDAANGLEGFEKYKAVKPDLVLTDMDMPIMNGYETCRKIREFDPYATIIILTGDSQGTNAQKALKEGYTSLLLQKPISISFLLKIIKRLLSQQPLRIRSFPKDSGYRRSSHSIKNLQCA